MSTSADLNDKFIVYVKMLHCVTPSVTLDDDVFGVDYIAECGSYNEDKGHSRHQSYNVIPVFLNIF